MGILSIQLGQAGLVDVKPRLDFINTNNTESEVIASGYLNAAYKEGFLFNDGDCAIVTTKTSPNSPHSQVGIFTVTQSGSNWSLTPVLDGTITATVNLTAAQILGMYATPVQLLAAPGAGKLILIDSILWDINYGTAQYAAGGAIAAQYGNTIHGGGAAASGTLAAATLNAVAADALLTEAGIAGSLNVAPASALNTAIYLSNATAAFTTGDSTATLYIRYRIVTPA